MRAAKLGLTQRDVASNVLTTLSSSAIVNPSYFLNPNGVNYTVAVQTPLERMSSVEDLMATPITSGSTPVLDNTAAAKLNAALTWSGLRPCGYGAIPPLLRPQKGRTACATMKKSSAQTQEAATIYLQFGGSIGTKDASGRD